MTDPRDHAPRGHHRQRARRGMVRGAILHLLQERPMHGYELINELEQRTGGRWRPSPGSVYPTLAALEDEGLVTGVEAEGKKRYELTDAGRAWASEHADRAGRGGPPWARGGGGDFGPIGDLRRLGAELFGQLRQIGRFGSPDQQHQAREILERTRAELYTVLAQPPTEQPED